MDLLLSQVEAVIVVVEPSGDRRRPLQDTKAGVLGAVVSSLGVTLHRYHLHRDHQMEVGTGPGEA